jgi:hypothetical protein
VVAARAIACGEEITIDYRYLLAPGTDIGFADSVSGRRIVGFSWRDNVRTSTRNLLRVVAEAE